MKRIVFAAALLACLGACSSSGGSSTTDDASIGDGDGDGAVDDAAAVDGGPCEAGALEQGTCGRCGTNLRVCNGDGSWSNWSLCQGETGECVAGETATEACEAGGSRARTCSASCSWGPWGSCVAPDAGPVDAGPCEAGATEQLPCGKCGRMLRVCSAGKWSDFSDCIDEKECQAGYVEERACSGGTQSRTCSSTCAWGAYGPCEASATCTPGSKQEEPCGNCGQRVRVCETTATWSSWSSCAGEGACAAGATESRACVPGPGTETRACAASCTWGAWGGCSSATSGCAASVTAKQPFPSGNMWGCGGKVAWASASSLCAPGFHVCTAAEFVSRRGADTAQNHYWTADALKAWSVPDSPAGSGNGGCTVTPTGPLAGDAIACPAGSPMRVCSGKQVDAFSNYCDYYECGYLTPKAHEIFGGCDKCPYMGTPFESILCPGGTGSYTTAGALCCK